MKHEFGGLWTRKKLELLEKYMKFYTTALKNTPFTLHYVDAFAGTGKQNSRTKTEQKELLTDDSLPGSVSIALSVEPTFDTFHFNDLDPAHAESIRKIAGRHQDKTILVSESDANAFISDFCRSMQKMDRAIVFLDPFSAEVDWRTLELIAQTQKADLWLLFPLSTLMRMTPKNGAQIRPEWSEKLNRLLGTTDWEKSLYREKLPPVSRDLFEQEDLDPLSERINVDELSVWLTTRLEEIFSYIASPVTLQAHGRPLFLFIFAVANPSEKAKALANRVVKHIIKSSA